MKSENSLIIAVLTAGGENMEIIRGHWAWYVAGPLLGLFVPFLLIYGNKLLGISSSFEHLCLIILPRSEKLREKYDKNKNGWKFYFVIGILLGALISQFLLSGEPVSFLPAAYYNPAGFLKLFFGGLLIGFGTRYANGCTSGHTITGLSLLNPASLAATVTFFVSGMAFTLISVYLFA